MPSSFLIQSQQTGSCFDSAKMNYTHFEGVPGKFLYLSCVSRRKEQGREEYISFFDNCTNF
jgi:hypothetical protein